MTIIIQYWLLKKKRKKEKAPWYEDPLLEYHSKVFNAQSVFPGAPYPGPNHQGTEEHHQDEQVLIELGNEVNLVGGDK